jgi:hypothetical protein
MTQRKPQRGWPTQLVRWTQSRDGWVAEIRRGRCVRTDAGGWVLDIGGRHQRFDREVWSRFAEDSEVAEADDLVNGSAKRNATTRRPLSQVRSWSVVPVPPSARGTSHPVVG